MNRTKKGEPSHVYHAIGTDGHSLITTATLQSGLYEVHISYQGKTAHQKLLIQK
ncbi:MAG: hypothetical protein IPK62_09340 [Bacteroidetes bacterium]|nr:hypothetical protein [Bacteroidota bacterium]